MYCGGKLVKNGRKILRRKSVREVTVEKVQQWWCEKCRASFTFRRNKKRTQYATALMKEAVEDFVMGGSYRRIKERRNVSTGTLSTWIHGYGERCMNGVEIADKLSLTVTNSWSGILLLDGKYLNRNMVLLLAVDYVTQDIVYWRVEANESKESYQRLITEVQNCGYLIRALVSDGGSGIRALTQKKRSTFTRKGTRGYPRPGMTPATVRDHPLLENIPHQWCVVHAQRELLKYVRKVSKKGEKEELIILVNQILFASTLAKAEKAKEQLNTYGYLNESEIAQRIMHILSSYWHLLTTHYTVRVNRRKIPSNTNAIENVICYLNTRLKTLRKIKTKNSATAICNLIVLNYRLKPLTDSENKLKKNKSPLELSSRKKMKLYWYSFIKKSCP